MIRSYSAALLAVLFTSAPLFVSCKDDIAHGADSSAPESIKIGVVLGRQGSTEQSAKDILSGIRVAEYQVNSLGGIGGRPVEFLVEDDKDQDNEVLTDLLSGFVAKGAIGVIGPIRSGQVTAAAAITNHQIALISPSATAASLSDLNEPGDPWIFRTIPNDAVQVRAMVKFATDGLDGKGGGCTKMAVVYEDDAYGAGFDTGLAAAFAKSGRSMAKRQPLDEVVLTDYTAVIEAIAATKPDCMALIAVEDVGGAFAISLRNARVAKPTLFSERFFVIATDGLYNEGFIKKSTVAGVAYADGFFGTVAAPNPPGPSLAQFLVLRRQFESNDKLSSYVAGSYDAAMLLMLARAQAGSDDPTEVRDALLRVSSDSSGDLVGPADVPAALASLASGASINYNGASGPVDFQQPAGDVVAGFLLWSVQGSKFQDIGSYKPEELKP